MKLKIALTLFLLIPFIQASKADDTTQNAYGRLIQKSKAQDKVTYYLIVQDGEQKLYLPLELNSQQEKSIKKLKLSDDVLLKGKISLRSTKSGENKNFYSVFVVEEIHPNVLASLGVNKEMALPPSLDYDQVAVIRTNQPRMYRPTLNIPSNVAGAMFLTASSLFALQLAHPASENAMIPNQLNAGVLLGAGLLFIGNMIYQPSP